MDEATSSVDPSTEKALLVAATSAFAGRTVITIAVSNDRYHIVYCYAKHTHIRIEYVPE
jgi:ABC-type bacteriocin/lantibiotic exporter with double-glycine peptidase domain